MHLKVFLKLKKNPKNPLVWAKKPIKTQKNPKKPTGLGFLKRNPGFFQPWSLSGGLAVDPQVKFIGVRSGWQNGGCTLHNPHISLGE
jgi:hypothetical protein